MLPVAAAPGAYGPGSRGTPLVAAEATAPTTADILQPPLDAHADVDDDGGLEAGVYDDYLDDQVTDEDAYHEIGFVNLDWWDAI
eukprot:7111282-Pyramimonas_sp.AAC.1